MRPIAVRTSFGSVPSAATNRHHRHILSYEGNWLEFCSFVRSITEWLSFGQSTGTPVVFLAWFQPHTSSFIALLVGTAYSWIWFVHFLFFLECELDVFFFHILIISASLGLLIVLDDLVEFIQVLFLVFLEFLAYQKLSVYAVRHFLVKLLD